MKKIYYVRDENGTILSADSKTKYRVVQGEELFDFINGIEKRGRFFYLFEEDDVIIGIECSKEQYKEYRKRKNHEYYINKKNSLEINSATSLNLLVKNAEEIVEVIETIEDESCDIEKVIEEKDTKERLYSAINQLSEEERDLIIKLFFLDNPMSEREIAKQLGVTQPLVNYKKKQILKKLKSFL